MPWELALQRRGALVQPPESQDWGSCGAVELTGHLNEASYLTPGWTRTSNQPLPAFTTSRPRETPGRRPAGLDKLNDSERQKWAEDAFRFPPYQYQECFQLKRGTDRRLVNVEEREVILGFPRHYTAQRLPKSQQGTVTHQDTRLTLLGNSWNVTVVTWLLGQLFSSLGIIPQLSVQECVDRTAPGSTTDLATYLTKAPLGGPRKQLVEGKEMVLVKKLLNLASIKGEDILISSSSEDALRYHCLRASLPSSLWV